MLSKTSPLPCQMRWNPSQRTVTMAASQQAVVLGYCSLHTCGAIALSELSLMRSFDQELQSGEVCFLLDLRVESRNLCYWLLVKQHASWDQVQPGCLQSQQTLSRLVWCTADEIVGTSMAVQSTSSAENLSWTSQPDLTTKQLLLITVTMCLQGTVNPFLSVQRYLYSLKE